MSRNQALDKKKLIERLHKMPIVEAACKQVGLPRATYYRWRKDDEEFATACDEAIEQSAGMINDLAESQLIASIKDKNMSAIMFWLKHHHAAYRARLEIDAHMQTEQQVLTPEQAQIVAHALRLAGMQIAEVDDGK
jgi:hypothetical protein